MLFRNRGWEECHGVSASGLYDGGERNIWALWKRGGWRAKVFRFFKNACGAYRVKGMTATVCFQTGKGVTVSLWAFYGGASRCGMGIRQFDADHILIQPLTKAQTEGLAEKLRWNSSISDVWNENSARCSFALSNLLKMMSLGSGKYGSGLKIGLIIKNALSFERGKTGNGKRRIMRERERLRKTI